MRQITSFLFLSLAVTFTVGLYSPSDGLTELTASNFHLVQNSADIYVVQFLATWCGHCKSAVPEMVRLAAAVKGYIKVGYVNVEEHQSLGAKYNVRGFPTIKIFGVNKEKPIDYNGARTALAIFEVAFTELKKKVMAALGASTADGNRDSSSVDDDVIELTNDNFDHLVLGSDDHWLVEFYAPWCGHCKNLAPEWAKASTQLKGKVRLGALDATVNQQKAAEYKVQGYPTIKYFGPGAKGLSDAEEYNGGRTASVIVSWATEKYNKNIIAPDIIEMIDEKSFRTACEEKPLCVISVLPHILDCNAKCRNGYINILQEMGERYKKNLWGWTWTEGGKQLALEHSLEIGGFGYPAMAILNFKKMKLSTLKGSFSKDGINEFLRDISYGRGQTVAVRGAEKPVIDTTQPWDGKDGEMPTEEDIDLSDVNLDENKDEL